VTLISMSDDSLHAAYGAAARAFLLKDHEGALDSLTRLTAALASPPVDGDSASWIIDPVSPDSPPSSSDELRRKTLILRTTVLATVCASPDLDPLLRARPEYAGLAGQPADAVAARLYHDAVAVYDPSSSPLSTSGSIDSGTALLPLAGPGAARLPPSIAVSCALTAIKLGSARTAKAICEAWMGSMDEHLEAVLEAEGLALEAETTTTTQGSSVAEEGSLARSSADLSLSVSPNDEPRQRALLRSYERLYEVYVLHVLPKLDEWSEAEEAARMGLCENGGILRAEKVQVGFVVLSSKYPERMWIFTRSHTGTSFGAFEPQSSQGADTRATAGA
jgi:hypothetical protein